MHWLVKTFYGSGSKFHVDRRDCSKLPGGHYHVLGVPDRRDGFESGDRLGVGQRIVFVNYRKKGLRALLLMRLVKQKQKHVERLKLAPKLPMVGALCLAAIDDSQADRG